MLEAGKDERMYTGPSRGQEGSGQSGTWTKRGRQGPSHLGLKCMQNMGCFTLKVGRSQGKPLSWALNDRICSEGDLGWGWVTRPPSGAGPSRSVR